MKRTVLLLVSLLVLSVVSATAGTTVLTFEGLQDEEAILNYYNGGFGGNGSGPGPNYGITFGADSLAIISGANGGSGNFSGAPSMPTIAFFLSGAGDVMDVPAGFDTGFSFYYSAINDSGTVDVYSGLDGTGSLLASIYLPVTPSGGSPECTYGAFCPWFPIGVSFAGTAESAVFTGTANQIGFDNITLGASTPVGAPEPTTLALLGSGLLGLLGMNRRRKS
ncbi:MAG TPA: PEP-CTERM sorting domain-containing protein [Terriglobia bacterium]|nr:PEP-CTERM sorting domain-containing protein [Terriglobia bacterium]